MACAGVSTVNDDVPELPECILSPVYAPVMVMKPAAAGGLYVMAHEAVDDNVHEVAGRPEILKLPPLPPSLNVTMPVGADSCPTEVSDTVVV